MTHPLTPSPAEGEKTATSLREKALRATLRAELRKWPDNADISIDGLYVITAGGLAGILDASEAKDRRIEALEAENEQLRTALGFYRDGFQFHPKRSPTGINLSEWKAKQELLDDCGNVAIAALSGKEGQS